MLVKLITKCAGIHCLERIVRNTINTENWAQLSWSQKATCSLKHHTCTSAHHITHGVKAVTQKFNSQPLSCPCCRTSCLILTIQQSQTNCHHENEYTNSCSGVNREVTEHYGDKSPDGSQRSCQSNGCSGHILIHTCFIILFTVVYDIFCTYKVVFFLMLYYTTVSRGLKKCMCEKRKIWIDLQHDKVSNATDSTKSCDKTFTFFSHQCHWIVFCRVSFPNTLVMKFEKLYWHQRGASMICLGMPPLMLLSFLVSPWGLFWVPLYFVCME